MDAAQQALDSARAKCEESWYLMEIAKVLHDEACPEGQDPTSECWRSMFEWFRAMDLHKDACEAADAAEIELRDKAQDVVDCVGKHKWGNVNVWF